jgi:hypothetical protein
MSSQQRVVLQLVGQKPLTVKKVGFQTWVDSLDKQPKQQNMDMRFGSSDKRSPYMAGH